MSARLHSLPRYPVQHMRPQPVSHLQIRMLKVVGRIMGHAKLLHHATRSQIQRSRERNQTIQPKYFECVTHDLSCAFGRQPLSPMVKTEPPTNFNSGHERSIEARNRETDKPHKGAGPTQLRRVEPKATRHKVTLK